MNHIRDGGDPDKFEAEGDPDNTEKQNEERDSNNNMSREQLVAQLENMKKLKEYAVKNGNRNLLHTSETTIRELEWLLSGGPNLVQPAITNFFSRKSDASQSEQSTG